VKPSLSIDQFCEVEGFGRSTFYKLRNLGRGPKLDRVPGTTIQRITPEAHAAWRRANEKYANSKAAKLEEKRRKQMQLRASRAGVAARWPKKEHAS